MTHGSLSQACSTGALPVAASTTRDHGHMLLFPSDPLRPRNSRPHGSSTFLRNNP